MKRRFIGDVHDRYGSYKKLIRGTFGSIQVGDMGIGFRRLNGSSYPNPPYRQMVKAGARFIRGNHDNPAACKRQTQWIEDGYCENDMMFVGGAQSVDQLERTEGYDWWPDEELNIIDLAAIVDRYIERKPAIMITHDCPQDVAQIIAPLAGRSTDKLKFQSRTRQALQAMLSVHSPKLWIFGHWHHSFDQTAQGTRFICLDILEHKDIEV